MEDTSKKFCQILFDVMEEKGVRDFVCSPGSRNVPLLMAAAARRNLRKHFAIDERSGAFMGMGISLVSRKPVGLICTSGTALLNYSPAVAEAYYQSVPLIVISADRPIQWIDQDDSQTLRQDDALINFVKKSYSIPAIGEDNHEMEWFVNRIANDAVLTATTGRPGPVHINIHLSEPLYKSTPLEDNRQRLIQVIEGDTIGNKEFVKSLGKKLSESKILLVAGFNTPSAPLQKVITDFSQFPNVAVMTESISNLHLEEKAYSIDSVLTAYDTDILDKLAPDIVISIGGALVSRKLKEYLRRNRQRCEHWFIGFSHTTSDPFMCLTTRFETDPVRFFRSINFIMRKCRPTSHTEDYKNRWNELKVKALELKNRFIRECEWSELKAFDTLLNNLPSDYNLFLSNGTPVRYAQIISYTLPHASYCNRGVSGIDGSLSTAIGGSIAFKGNTVLVTGDLSMAYDIGALALRETPERFKIVVIDNQGGGIFRFIPSTSELDIREEYLCQQPILPLPQLADGYGWKYFDVNNEESLKKTLPLFFSQPHKSILKISCPGEESARILKSYMALKADVVS